MRKDEATLEHYFNIIVLLLLIHSTEYNQRHIQPNNNKSSSINSSLAVANRFRFRFRLTTLDRLIARLVLLVYNE